MSDDEPRETFIPFQRADVIKMCLQDGRLKEDEQAKFKTFCEILTAYYHFSFHSIQERLKAYFTPADPDSDLKPFLDNTEEENEQQVDRFFEDFEKILIKANFRPLNQEDLEIAFQKESLIHLRIDVDFDHFERSLVYYRGTKKKTTTVKSLFYFNKELTFDVLDRVILLLKYKDKEYFEQKGIKLSTLNFTPGRTYIFYYKNVPKADLEILFPNIKISMTWKDRLLFLLPAIGVGIGTLIKSGAQVLLLFGLIFFLVGMTSLAENFGFDQENLIPMIVTITSISTVLAGFFIKQYMTYKNKWVKFLNDLTQTLFFRSISINAGVFQCLIDNAEEEECKEAILAYYHLLTSEEKLTKQALDERIEQWFEDHFDTALDFDVEDALEKLETLKGVIVVTDQEKEAIEERRLIAKDEDGHWLAQPLDTAVTILDSIWDNIFQYNVVTPLDGENG